MKNKILAATGTPVIDEVMKGFPNYEVLDCVMYRAELLEACEYHAPDILVVTEALSGNENLTEIIIKITKTLPHTRIVYLAGDVDKRDSHSMNMLGVLAMSGVYDINLGGKVNPAKLKDILDHPKTLEDIQYLIDAARHNSGAKKTQNLIEFEVPEELEEDNFECKNLYVVSSIKPGTGKSFLSTNIAAAIAQFGVENKDGKKPKVAIIEADLQNLSVGTLLQIEDEKENLKTVVKKISTVISEKGITGNLAEIEDANRFIKNCFKPYCKIKNLEALVGSQLTISEIENIQPYHYVYLIEAIMNDYDIIIIDSNSSVAHITTFPLLQMAKTCYYVLNLDFNNVRNNCRYKSFLKEMGIEDKVKYVLNEDIINNSDFPACGTEIEELIYTADHLDDSQFKLEARIPMIPKTVFLNRLYEGTPIVLDDHKYTTKARFEIMKVANQIWPIKNFKQMEEDMEKKQSKKRGIFR